MGFQESPEDGRELILTKDAAQAFTENYRIYKEG